MNVEYLKQFFLQFYNSFIRFYIQVYNFSF